MVGPELGIVVPITSLTGTTIVSSALARGEPDTAYSSHLAVRRDAASQPADRVRRVTAFAGSTGTLTVATMADTTATSETLELMNLGVDPRMLDQACQDTLRKLKRRDRTPINGYQGTRYWLDGLSWITQPADVTRVTWRPSPILTRNQYFEKWLTVNSSGTRLPDQWTLTGASATATRSTTGNREGVYTVAVLRSGTDARLTQDVQANPSGSAAQSLQGQVVTAVCRVTSSTASAVRVRIVEDGSVTASSSFHTGGGSLETLTVSVTVGATTAVVTLRVSVEVDSTAYVDRCFLMLGSTVSDAVYQNAYQEEDVAWEFDQGASPLALILEPRTPGTGQYIVESIRPYPQFDADRIAAGTADADDNDAPLTPVATGIAAHTFAQLARQSNSEDSTKWGRLAMEWMEKFEPLQKRHLYTPDNPHGGWTPRLAPYGPAAHLVTGRRR